VYRTYKSNFIIPIFIWIIFSIVNFNKSVTVDDTFYIEQAKWIAKNPTKPLSGSINWMDKSRPIYNENNPPLFSYTLSFFMFFFGENIAVFHFVTSLFLLGLLFYVYKITKFLTLNSLNFWLIFFISPMLIINQNIMLDIPLNFFLFGSFYFFLKSEETEFYAYFGSIFLGFAFLTKYSALAFWIIPFLYFIKTKKTVYIKTLLIILCVMIFWFTWNYYEIGNIHLFIRKKNIHFEYEKILSFIICLGNIMLFSSFSFFKTSNKNKKIYITILSVLFFIPTTLYLMGEIERSIYFYSYTLLCFLFGTLCIYHLATFLNKKSPLNIMLIASVLYTILILYASPFIATRHFIPIVLLIGLLISSNFIFPKFLIVLNIAWTFMIGVSDVCYSQIYQNISRNISAKFAPNKMYTLGHNGWQYYSQKNKINFYDIDSSKLKDGDIMIIPSNTNNQLIDSSLKMEIIDIIVPKPNINTFFIGRKLAPYGSNYMNFVPFIFSTSPVDSFYIYKIQTLPS